MSSDVRCKNVISSHTCSFPQSVHPEPQKSHGSLPQRADLHAPTSPPPTHKYSHKARTLTLFSTGLRGWIISAGVALDGWREREREISSCTHSLYLLEAFHPIRSHWWRFKQRHKWVDSSDHVQITTLSLSETLRPVTRAFCAGRHKLDLMLQQLSSGKI